MHRSNQKGAYRPGSLRLNILVLLLFIALVTWSGLAPQAAVQVKSEATPELDTLRIAISEAPASLDPIQGTNHSARVINSVLYDRLTYVDDDHRVKGWLAESWHLEDQDKRLIMQLRPDRFFHDGTAVNAEAVAFNFQRILHEKPSFLFEQMVGPLLSCEATGTFEVTFTFEHPYAPFLRHLASPYFGLISPNAYRQQGDAFAVKPVGSGPMKFVIQTEEGIWQMAKDPHYQELRVTDASLDAWSLKKMEFHLIPNFSDQLHALDAGTLHLAPAPRAERAQLEAHPDLGIFVWEDTHNLTFLEFNMQHLPFADRRMRQAIAYALDVEAIVEDALQGCATPNRLPLPTGVHGHCPKLEQQFGYSYDPKKAESLLVEMGWSHPDANGRRYHSDYPEPLAYWSYGTANVIRASESIEAQLGTIGLALATEIYETSTLLARLSEGVHDFNIMRWTWFDPAFLGELLLSPGWNGLTPTSGLDPLLLRANQTFDEEERFQLVGEIQSQILEEMLILPLFTDWTLDVHRLEVNGLRRCALGYLQFQDVHVAE